MMQSQDGTMDVSQLVAQALALDPDKMMDLVRALKTAAKRKKDAEKSKDQVEVVEAREGAVARRIRTKVCFDSAQALTKKFEPLREKLAASAWPTAPRAAPLASGGKSPKNCASD